MIELCGITKSFSGKKVLDNVSLFVQEGEIFSIIGKSGAGKSTVLRIMNFLEVPDAGYVIIDGQTLNNLSQKELSNVRHKIGMIFQQFNLLNSKTVYDNIALPMRIQGISEEEIRYKIEELLPVVELSDKKNSYPHSLSGGQKQRVAIARALASSPKILLCDEATSALDPETTESILNLLKKINQIYGITIILITHEMEVVKRISKRLSVMKHGQLVETIPLASVFTKDQGIAREMLYAQLCPQLPTCVQERLVDYATDRPLLRLFFRGDEANIPFISQTSRELKMDINIILATIDSFDGVICGVIIVELNASHFLLEDFIARCNQTGIKAEVIGYDLPHG